MFNDPVYTGERNVDPLLVLQTRAIRKLGNSGALFSPNPWLRQGSRANSGSTFIFAM
ncbi:MAG: hypothetical protein K0S39_1067 [Paenibacillus sp.]|jgi:hypothetical protein|nr:hypothetical protein [Paenibacillus sp.]